MANNKLLLAVNHNGYFVNEGRHTKYVSGSMAMLSVRINHMVVSIVDFMADIRVGLQREDVTRVFYRPDNQMGSFLLIYDKSSLENFVYLFLNNKVDEIFVEHDPSEVVDNVPPEVDDRLTEAVVEGVDLLPLPWQQPDLSTEAEVDYDFETVSSETNTSDSCEQDKENLSNERGGSETRPNIQVAEAISRVSEGVKGSKDNDDDDTDYAKSDDELVEIEDSDEEQEDRVDASKRTKHDFPHFDVAGRVPVFAIGMVFDDLKQFKDAIDRHSILEQRAIHYQRNSFYYMRAKCSDAKCPWHITASINKRIGELQVKTYEPKHVCQQVYKNNRATSKWLAEEFRDDITSAPSIQQGELKDMVRKRLGLNIHPSKARKARERVLLQLECDYTNEYGRLWDYVRELRKSNTTVVLDVIENEGIEKPDFRRMYICFDACRQGFLAECHPIVGMDGCFLKGLCKGQLLSAIGRDANNGMFSIAWSVVGKENEDNWRWFLGLLKSEMGIVGMGERWTFISDRQKGLLNAVEKIFPKSEHRFCARHLNSNWRVRHPAKRLDIIFWSCVKSANKADFRQTMENLQAHSPAAFADLKEVDFCHWVKAYFRTNVKCDAIENNMCEAFNAKILKFRSKAIITMLEGIRNYVMKRMHKQKGEAFKWVRDCSPHALEKLEEARFKSRFCKVKFAGDHGVEIEYSNDVYVVDVNGRTCTCCLWQLRGIPCQHAVSAIHYQNLDVEDFVDSCYKKAAFLAAYQQSLPLIPSMRFWESSGLIGPAMPSLRKRRGRCEEKCKKEPLETMGKRMTQKGQVQTYSRCDGEGHNKRGCKGVDSSTAIIQKSQQQLPTTPAKRQRKEPCRYGIIYDTERHRVIQNLGTRAERVLTSTEEASSTRVANEFGSQGAPSEPQSGVISQEPIGTRPLPLTPKSRHKQPVRRGPRKQSKSRKPDDVDLED